MLILALTITGCVSAFASLACVPVGITSSAVWIRSCVITTGIKKCKSIIKQKKEKHNRIVLLVKDELITFEVVISNALIDSYISR